MTLPCYLEPTADDETLKQIVLALQQAQSVLILGHVNPDGDAIGSSRALALALEAMGKKVATGWGGSTDRNDETPMVLPKSWSMFAGSHTVVMPDELAANPERIDFDVAIACDLSEAKRLGTMLPYFQQAPVRIVIDHHLCFEPLGTLNFIDANQISCCGLMVDVLDALEVPITQDMANLLLFGMTTDSGNFVFEQTTANDYRKAARLIDEGAQVTRVNNAVYNEQQPNYLPILQQGLTNLTIDKPFIWSYLTNEELVRLEATHDQTDGIIELLRSVGGPDITVLMCEVQPGFWRTSLRSRGNSNVEVIARQLNGGGHKRAAGCTLLAANQNEAYAQVVASYEKYRAEEQARLFALDGVITVDKPAGITSQQVVGRIRKILGTKIARRGKSQGPKVGHAGTLDPSATGLLLVAIGKATKLVPWLQSTTKVYETTITFGITTDSLDADGQEITRVDASHITPEAIAAVIPAFVGEIQQIPPMVSAIKIDGERLHEKARRGEVVEREARTITIENILQAKFIPGPHPQVTLIVACSAGTYIRTLADDIGQALGVGAIVQTLRRLSSGQTTLDSAVKLDDLNRENIADYVQSKQQALEHLPQKVLNEATICALRQGQAVKPLGVGDNQTVGLDADNEVVCIFTDDSKRVQTAVVFT